MLDSLVIGQVGSSGLSDIVSFFNNQSSGGDVSNALSSAGIAFKIAMFLIMFIGAIAMAIWIGRIAVDILLIVTRGTKLGESEKVKKLGTGGSDSYASVGTYLKGNLLEIILVIVLITFLMTGWLFRLIAIALSGFGALGNKLLGLDIEGTLSAIDAEAFKENVSVRRTASLKIQYDEELGSARAEAARLYEMAKDGAVSDNPKFVKAKRLYTTNMIRADILAKELADVRNAQGELKLEPGYFNQHLRQNGDGVCNEGFIVEEISTSYGESITCSN